MSGKKTTEVWGRTVKAADQLKPAAAQVKPIAKSTGDAARRQIFRTRAWAAPRVERTGKVIQDSVAPRVSSMLGAAAQKIDPAKPHRGRWRLPVGLAAAAAAAASAAAAVFRSRAKTDSAAPAAPADEEDDATASAVSDTRPDAVVSDTEVRAS